MQDHRAPSVVSRFRTHSRIILLRIRSRRGRSLSNAARHIASRSSPVLTTRSQAASYLSEVYPRDVSSSASSACIALRSGVVAHCSERITASISARFTVATAGFVVFSESVPASTTSLHSRVSRSSAFSREHPESATVRTTGTMLSTLRIIACPPSVVARFTLIRSCAPTFRSIGRTRVAPAGAGAPGVGNPSCALPSTSRFFSNRGLATEDGWRESSRTPRCTPGGRGVNARSEWCERGESNPHGLSPSGS